MPGPYGPELYAHGSEAGGPRGFGLARFVHRTVCSAFTAAYFPDVCPPQMRADLFETTIAIRHMCEFREDYAGLVKLYERLLTRTEEVCQAVGSAGLLLGCGRRATQNVLRHPANNLGRPKTLCELPQTA